MSEIPEGATHHDDGVYPDQSEDKRLYHKIDDKDNIKTYVKGEWVEDGNSKKYISILTPIKQDKEMIIDFKGKAFALENKPTGNLVSFDSYVSNSEYYDIGDSLNYSCKDWALHANKEYKKAEEMIYTKEMFNNSETPKVGMQIGVRFNKASKPNYGKLIALTNQYIILLEGEAQEQHYHRGTWIFVPVDTRTDKEKAIDDIKRLLISVAEKSFDSKAEVIIEKSMAGKIHGITFTGDK